MTSPDAIGAHDRRLLRSIVDVSDDEIDDLIEELGDELVLEHWESDGSRFRR